MFTKSCIRGAVRNNVQWRIAATTRRMGSRSPPSRGRGSLYGPVLFYGSSKMAIRPLEMCQVADARRVRAQ
jgi:hypothetical protein